MLQTLFLASGGGTHVPDELILVIAMAVLMAVVLHSLRLPVITGLLLAGALIGPNGFQWVGHENETSIQMLSEIGLIMLMFTIGLEFSLKKLMKAWRLVLIGGALQAVLTGALAIGVSMAVGLPFAGAAVIAMIVIMSSTAIVLRGLTERGELDAPHGRFIVGVLIFQDLLVVPFMLMVPLLIPHEGGEPLPLAMLRVAGMTIGVVLVIILSTRAIVPRLFRIVANTRSREVFVLAVVAVCTGTAWVTQQLGLSMALGAFLAGMVLADSDFGNRAIGDMLPLRDVLTSVFFVSLGMLFQANAVIDHPVTVLLILVALVVGKTIIATIAALAMKFPARVAWLAGVGLAQLSEFGVVLAGMSEAQQLVPRDVMSPLLAAGVMSMFLTPLMIRLAPHVTAGERVLRRLERILGVRGVDDRGDFAHKELEDHVVVVGYGVGGKLICRALRDSDVPYIVLELNAGTVRAARATGENIYYGDCTSAEAMHHAGLQNARALVLMINDPEGARRSLAAAREFAPSVPIFLRARYLGQRAELLATGASDVVFEEVEAGAEMLARVLRRLDFPGNLIRRAVRSAREFTQPSGRKVLVSPRDMDEADFGVATDTYRVAESSHVCGKSLRDLDLRAKTHCLVAAIRRGDRTLGNPDPHMPLAAGDVLVLVGDEGSIIQAEHLLDEGTEAPASRMWTRAMSRASLFGSGEKKLQVPEATASSGSAIEQLVAEPKTADPPPTSPPTSPGDGQTPGA